MNKLQLRCVLPIIFACGAACQSGAQMSEKDKLVDSLIEKGDQAKLQDKEAARAAFWFARAYSAKAKTPEIDKRIESLGGHEFSASNAEIGRMQNAVYWTTSADYRDFSARTEAMDMVNLRMLLDGSLVGNLRYSSGQSSLGSFNFFLHDSKMKVSDVRQKYGSPSAERKEKNGQEILTYGLLRIVGKPDGTVAVVLFSLP